MGDTGSVLTGSPGTCGLHAPPRLPPGPIELGTSLIVDCLVTWGCSHIMDPREMYRGLSNVLQH